MTNLVDFLERHSLRVILGVTAFSFLLVIPMITMAPDEIGSSDPSGEVFDLQEDIDDRFQSPIHGASFIVESRDGDVLTQPVLAELYRNEQNLLEADRNRTLSPEDLPSQTYLYSSFDLDTNRPIVGVSTIADAVQGVLANDPRFGTSLEEASDEQVKIAVHLVLSAPETSGLVDTLAVDATHEPRMVGGMEIDYWTAEAMLFNVLADNEKLGGGTLSIGASGGEETLDKEEFNRNAQEILRGEQRNFRLWGIAIDVNLESNDEGQVAGMFIMFTVIAAVLVVGVSLRSYWAMALTGVGLGFLMIWLKGITALIGIKGGLVIELIVPIAMISLGVDFAVHALKRYQEERDLGYDPVRALRIGLAGVGGALVLAMFSDSIAFLSNTSSGIEAVIHFGVAAAVAVGSSFIVLGIVVPLAMMRIDCIRAVRPGAASVIMRVFTVSNGIGAAVLSGTAVIFLVAVSEVLGLAVLVGVILGFIVLPVFVLSRRSGGRGPVPDAGQEEQPSGRQETGGDSIVEAIVGGLAGFAPAVLLVTVAVTAATVVFALKLEPTFDVQDFFDNSSDFVVSLDKLDEHVQERGGEPGIIYIRGDLTQHQSLAAIQDFIDALPNNEYLARDASGVVQTGTTILDTLRRITGNDYARAQISQATSVEITDSDDDGIPDSQEQLAAVYGYIVQNGVPLDALTLLYDPDQVRESLYHDPTGGDPEVTIMTVGIIGSREQANVTAAGDALRLELDRLTASPSIEKAGLTGSPFTREAQLNATTKTLQLSIPIAAAGALLLLLVAMRSVRYAVVTIIPIGLVVAWLYGFMQLSGFALNFVTATIGAVSVGVGIDYSIHMTERFREELERSPDKMTALRRAAKGTGVALVASAASSIVGFGILGFAPMPLFSSYGILTAVMIFLALAASILVLPSLLVLVTRKPTAEHAVTSPDAAAGPE